MKWLLSFILCLPATLIIAQEKNPEITQANVFHEEEIYASQVTVDEVINKVKPASLKDLPMAVGQMVSELKDNNGSVLTYEVITGNELNKTYFLAVVTQKDTKQKIYYDKEGKIAKAITLFD